MKNHQKRNAFRPQAGDLKDNLKIPDEWKIDMIMKLKSMLSTDSNDKCTMYSRGNSNIYIVSNDTGEIIQDFLINSCISIKRVFLSNL